MTRAEALEQFQQRHKKSAEDVREEFLAELRVGTGEMLERIYKAFGEIAVQAGEQGKEDCMNFIFSLLRYDLGREKARVRLDVTNAGWMLDRDPLCTELDLTFLFRPYFRWKKELLSAMREYMGKVNRYDVEYMVDGEIMESIRAAVYVLRYAFRDVETQAQFADIPKLPFWDIRFGEYRDWSDSVAQRYREPRSTEEWLAKLGEDRGTLACGHWYGAELKGGVCAGKDLQFIVFEECVLKGIDFGKAWLSGARFLGCRLESCSFEGTDLGMAEFRQCRFADCCFAGADLGQAVFTPEGLEAEWFDGKKQAEMLVAVEEKEGSAGEG